MHDGSAGTVFPPPVKLGARLDNPPLPTDSLQASKRIEGYDVARALAVLGMIVVNCRQILLTGSRKPVWFTGLADYLYGRPAVLFVILAGVGLSLMSQKAVSSGDPQKVNNVRFALIKRSIVLYIMGMFFMQWWGADILHFYGVFLSTGALLLSTSCRRLWAMITALLLSSGTVFLIMDSSMPGVQEWLSGGGMVGGWVDEVFISGNYPVFPWLMFLLFGLWLGRSSVIGDPVKRRSLLKASLLCVVCAETLGRLGPPFVFGILGLKDEGILSMLFMLNSFPMTPLFAISATGCGILVLIASLTGPWSLFSVKGWKMLQNTGKLSLTIYISHIFLFLWLDGWLRNRISGEIYPIAAVSLILAFCLLTPVAAEIWSRYYRRGPFEWFLRQTAAIRLW
jgi:uncharacterized protein